VCALYGVTSPEERGDGRDRASGGDLPCKVLTLGFIAKEKSVDRLRPMETQALVEAIREQLQQRHGFGH